MCTYALTSTHAYTYTHTHTHTHTHVDIHTHAPHKNPLVQLKVIANHAVEHVTSRQLAFEPELMTIRQALATIYQVGAWSLLLGKLQHSFFTLSFSSWRSDIVASLSVSLRCKMGEFSQTQHTRMLMCTNTHTRTSSIVLVIDNRTLMRTGRRLQKSCKRFPLTRGTSFVPSIPLCVTEVRSVCTSLFITCSLNAASHSKGSLMSHPVVGFGMHIMREIEIAPHRIYLFES